MKKHFDITDRLGGDSELGDDKQHLGGYGGEVGSFFGSLKKVAGKVASFSPPALAFRGARQLGRAVAGGKHSHHKQHDPALIAANTAAATSALSPAGVDVTPAATWDTTAFMKAAQTLKPVTFTYNGKTVPASLKMFVSANKVTVKRS